MRLDISWIKGMCSVTHKAHDAKWSVCDVYTNGYNCRLYQKKYNDDEEG